jgi:hypothetical protein
MHVDPELRSLAARTLLDALAAADVARAGEDAADDAMLLALAPMGIDTDDPREVANCAATTDLLFLLTMREAQRSGADYLEVVSNLRALLASMDY